MSKFGVKYFMCQPYLCSGILLLPALLGKIMLYGREKKGRKKKKKKKNISKRSKVGCWGLGNMIM